MKQYLSYLLIVVGLLGANTSVAQKKINQNFKFEDGIYTQHQAFKNNQPNFPLFKIPDFEYQLDSEKNLLFLSEKSLAQLPQSEIKSIDNIWGLCIKGKPYLKITPTDNKNEVYFVRYYILGTICYLYYPIFEEKSVEMFVHNPYTGKKVGSKTVINQEKKFIKKLLRFDTGLIQNYNAANFLAMIQDDTKLVATLVGLSQKEMDKKLFKSIKIYNDRNPIIIKK